MQKVNSDLVGKVVNIASRCAGFIHKGNAGVLVDANPEPELWAAFQAAAPSIAEAYEARDFARAMREIMALADRANAWIADKAPWALNKVEGKQAEVQEICALGVNLFRQLVILLKPVLPKLAADAEAFLNVAPLTWHDLATPLANHQLNPFNPLLTRIEPAKIDAMTEASKEDLAAEASKPAGNGELTKDPLAAEINFDAFAAVDLRIALIEKCEFVEGADKLLRLIAGYRRREAQRVLRHQVRLPGPEQAGRPPDPVRGQPGPAQDEVRRVRRHGPGRRPRRRGNLPAQPGQRRQAGSARQVS